MLSGLILTAFLMGLGGIPHCAAMCGAPCALAFPRGLPWPSLVGRCLAYAFLGAIAALSAGTVAAWGRQIAFMQPLWMMLLAAAVLLGLYLLRSGQMPAAVNNSAMDLYRRARATLGTRPLPGAARPFVPLLAGMAWVLMPCGLLYAALMVAVLAPHAWGGALVMLAFAIPGAFGVWAAPYVLRRLSRFTAKDASQPVAPATLAVPTLAGAPQQGVPVTWMAVASRSSDRVGEGAAGAAAPGASTCAPPAATTAATTAPPVLPAAVQFDPRWAVRASGLMLAGMAGWALYHQLWAQWQIWCA